MKKTRQKKGFTIIELVIVIAVIGILAAVLIPTFSSLMRKANASADQAAIKSMNTYLASDEQINGKPETIQEVLNVLAKSNLDAENYKPLAAGYIIVWDSGVNRVLYIEKSTDRVVYPEEYTSEGVLKLGYEYGTRFTLTGQMSGDDSWRTKKVEGTALNGYTNTAKDTTNSFKSMTEAEKEAKKTEMNYQPYFGDSADKEEANIVASEFKKDETIKSGMITYKVGNTEYTVVKTQTGEQLVSYATYVKEHNDGANITLIISEDIDMKGAQWVPVETYYGNIDGNDKEIKNFTMSDRTQEVAQYDASTKGGKYFYYGFISVFKGTYLANITLNNVSIVNPGLNVNAPNGFSKTGHAVGAVCGLVDNSEGNNVLLENIVVTGGRVEGMSRVGGLFCVLGTRAGAKMKEGSITIRNCRNYADVVSNVLVSGAHGTVGGIASITYNFEGGKMYFENCHNYGSITGQSAGGIIAKIYSAGDGIEVKDCSNSGTILGVMHDVTFSGGMAVKDTYTSVFAGGIIGDAASAELEFKNVINTGDISLTNTFDTDNAKKICGSTDGKPSEATVNMKAGQLTGGSSSKPKAIGCKTSGKVTVNINPTKINLYIYKFGENVEADATSNFTGSAPEYLGALKTPKEYK